jgi:hypothetical protein
MTGGMELAWIRGVKGGRCGVDGFAASQRPLKSSGDKYEMNLGAQKTGCRRRRFGNKGVNV